MKRWILVRAGKETAPTVWKPRREGTIGASPAWVDTRAAAGDYDYYAKKIREGVLTILDESDTDPRLGTSATRAASPSPAARRIQATEDLEKTEQDIQDLETKLKVLKGAKNPRQGEIDQAEESLSVLKKNSSALRAEIKKLEPPSSGSQDN